MIAALQALNMYGPEEIHQAKRVLLNITTGSEVSLSEMSNVAGIFEEISSEVQIIWGHVIDDEMVGDLQVAFIAGMDDKKLS